MNHTPGPPPGPHDPHAPSPRGASRREVVRQGLRLAFVAPALTTFFARDALAAGSNHSCYPVGHECGAGHDEECCPGLTCDTGGTDQCV